MLKRLSVILCLVLLSAVVFSSAVMAATTPPGAPIAEEASGRTHPLSPSIDDSFTSMGYTAGPPGLWRK